MIIRIDKHVGETVEIYYSTNSCCYYYLANDEELKHVNLVDRRTIEDMNSATGVKCYFDKIQVNAQPKIDYSQYKKKE